MERGRKDASREVESLIASHVAAYENESAPKGTRYVRGRLGSVDSTSSP
jgi:hypothetical protein